MLSFLLTINDEATRSKIEYIYNNFHSDMMKFAIGKFRQSGRSSCVYDAEDVVQSTLWKISKYIDNIDFTKTEKQIKNYVFSILANEINNFFSQNPINLEFDEENLEFSMYKDIEEINVEERYDEVVRAMKSLDYKYSSAMFLAYSEQMAPKQIAELMGISEKTVYSRLSRGKKLLLNILKGEGKDD